MKKSTQKMEKLIDKFTTIPHLENMQHITKFNYFTLKNTFEKNGYRAIRASSFNTISFFFPDKQVSSTSSSIELALALPFGNLLVSVFEVK